MIRIFGGFLLVLPAAAALWVAPAAAQSYGSPSSAVTEQQLPPPSSGVETRYDDRAMPGRVGPAPRDYHYYDYSDDPSGQEADALPPPGLPVQNGQSYGHQLGSQPLPTGGVPGNDPDAVRPPGAVGAIPGGRPA